MATLTIELSLDDRSRLGVLAIARGIPAADIAAEAVVSHLDQHAPKRIESAKPARRKPHPMEGDGIYYDQTEGSVRLRITPTTNPKETQCPARTSNRGGENPNEDPTHRMLCGPAQ